MISKMLWIQTLPSPERRCQGQWFQINMRPPKKKRPGLGELRSCVFFRLKIHVKYPKLHVRTVYSIFLSMLNFWIHKSFALSNSPLGCMSHVEKVWKDRSKGGSTMSPPWNLSKLLALGYKLFIHPRVITLRETKGKFTPENQRPESMEMPIFIGNFCCKCERAHDLKWFTIYIYIPLHYHTRIYTVCILDMTNSDKPHINLSSKYLPHVQPKKRQVTSNSSSVSIVSISGSGVLLLGWTFAGFAN